MKLFYYIENIIFLLEGYWTNVVQKNDFIFNIRKERRLWKFLFLVTFNLSSPLIVAYLFLIYKGVNLRGQFKRKFF